jgi:amidohydrolase
VSVGTVASGDAFNVIADRAQMSGTVRTHESHVRDRVHAAIERVASGVAQAHGCTATVTWTVGYPAAVNDPAHAAEVIEILSRTLDVEVVRAARPRMESDDFAYYLHKNLGNFFFVGSGGEDASTRLPHHHPAFDIDERAVGTIVDAYLAIALSGSVSDEAAH